MRRSRTTSAPSRRSASSVSRLAGGGVADEQHVGRLAAGQHDAGEGAVERHLAALHHRQVVQREGHLLEVPEVAEAILERHGADEQAAGRVFVEDRGRLAEARQRLGRRAVDEDGVGAGGDLLVGGHLEEVGQRQAQPDEALVDEHEHHQRPHDRRVAEEPAAARSTRPAAGRRRPRRTGRCACSPAGRAATGGTRARGARTGCRRGGRGGRPASATERCTAITPISQPAGTWRYTRGWAAGDVLGHVAVQAAHEVGEHLDGLVERVVRALVAGCRSRPPSG